MQPQQWAWQGLGWIWADFCTNVCWQKHSVRTLPSKWPPLLQPLLSEMCLGSIRGPDAHWKISHDSPEDVDQKATLSVKSSLGNCSWICYFILKILSRLEETWRSFSSFVRWRNWQKTVAWSGWIMTRELMPPKASAGLFPHPTRVFSIPVLSCHSHPGQGWEALCVETCFKWNDFIATGAS